MFKKLTLLLLSLLLVFPIMSQDNASAIHLEIDRQLKGNVAPASLSPFKLLKSNGSTSFYKYTPIKIPKGLLQINIPISATKEITVLLHEQNIFSNRNTIWKNQAFYRGIIINDPNSLVTLNINEGSLSGIISNNAGNIVLQPSNTQNSVIEIFSEKTRNNKNDWTCHSDPNINDKIQKNNKPEQKLNNSDTIKLYLECDYALFELHNSSVIQTMNYITGVMNEVSALYANENITLLIDDVKIWSTPDPYNDAGALAALNSFVSGIDGNFTADLAHLLSGKDLKNGGIAYINSLCDKSRAYAYSNVKGSYTDISSYSWDVHVLAHEIGHNLGSYHTHDCVWGPDNNQAIDGCSFNSCGGTIPAAGGTIMSYCHQTDEGINFSLGFGQEPGDLMRSTISTCRNVVGVNCFNAIVLSETGTYTSIDLISGNGANNSPAANANWFKFDPHTEGTISIYSCNQGVDTRLYLYHGDCDNLTQIDKSDDECLSGGGLFYASTLTDIPVETGVSYWIEWDDRWSSDAFDFEFEYNYEEIIDPCSNGIQDGTEEGVDCGGIDCAPCEDVFVDACANGIQDEGEEGVDCGGVGCVPCDECNTETFPDQLVENSLIYRSNSQITVNEVVSSESSLMVSSSSEIIFAPGFEVQMGGQLEAIIETCAEYYLRLQSIILPQD